MTPEERAYYADIDAASPGNAVAAEVCAVVNLAIINLATARAANIAAKKIYKAAFAAYWAAARSTKEAP